MAIKAGYIYILTNKNNRVLYAGVTNDLIRRIYEHKEKVISGFTKKYNLTKLVYYEIFSRIDDAIAREKQIKGSFFFTGRFYGDPTNELLINTLISDGHYLGAHSDRHLLYCDWDNRDSLLVDFATFSSDLESNYQIMQLFGIARKEAKYFLPPYEWYNNQISKWCRQMGIQLINYTPGTLSHTDYTTPESSNYRSSRLYRRLYG